MTRAIGAATIAIVTLDIRSGHENNLGGIIPYFRATELYPGGSGFTDGLCGEGLWVCGVDMGNSKTFQGDGLLGTFDKSIMANVRPSMHFLNKSNLFWSWRHVSMAPKLPSHFTYRKSVSLFNFYATLVSFSITLFAKSPTSSIRTSLYLLHPLHRTQPRHSTLRELLHPRLQLRLHQLKIINRPNPQDTHARKGRTNTIHQRTTSAAKVIRHHMLRGDRLGLAVSLEVFLTAEMVEMGVAHGEIGSEHGGGDFVAVGTIAEEGVDKTWLLGGLDSGC